ncbi:ATPase family associated with various cellular activities (AAA) [Poriferisphaera corsica]|uniref:ATPase family associated with various cellular activities (AAA) n=1 Tax=Poriferisphaera corsica TaxID=2528020 RepID=A0A517YQ71_9BACT|nr:MoxR family ATPase [Poriferisphaera corsica]QDU32374.1 ATPase family associated with various cellular activities (AAA) [Poriferisphaera corsica]
MNEQTVENGAVQGADLEQQAALFRREFTAIRNEVEKVIIGQARVVGSVLTAMFCGGNVLLEGVPGLGKTELVKALSRVLELDFSRIQFTPDLMPADIIGTNVMANKENEGGSGGGYRIEFRKGPIFTQLLLADEINRATPKTQSALLETMQEKTVTVSGRTYQLELPFFVLATQNPLEQEGTYPLPEAQLDRFMFKVNVPFLEREGLNEVVNRTILKRSQPIGKVIDGKRIMELGKILEQVVVTDSVRDFACRLVLATHPHSEFASDEVKNFVNWGASPRAAQALIKAARVKALAEGRVHVAHEDVQAWAVEVLQHRVLLNYDGQAERIDVAQLVEQIVGNLIKM